jgi:hypothetical protein
MTEHRVVFRMDIGNFQIDNLVSDDMPVLLGAKDFYDKGVNVASRSQSGFNLAHAYKLVQDEDMKPVEVDGGGRALDRLPFFRFNFIMSEKTQAGKIGSVIRYDNIQLRILEFFLQVETTILNDNIKFIFEVLDLFGK